MYIHVLGSAAGGGFPQWNCNCDNCHGVRQGTIQEKNPYPIFDSHIRKWCGLDLIQRVT
ncbi:coenzyme PQQ synthesis protein B [Psychrobacter sp. JCM 18901]|nr:coenzyme PQQ synthesis protein B [Psychrobacter sp. JCM 18901]